MPTLDLAPSYHVSLYSMLPRVHEVAHQRRGHCQGRFVSAASPACTVPKSSHTHDILELHLHNFGIHAPQLFEIHLTIVICLRTLITIYTQFKYEHCSSNHDCTEILPMRKKNCFMSFNFAISILRGQNDHIKRIKI